MKNNFKNLLTNIETFNTMRESANMTLKDVMTKFKGLTHKPLQSNVLKTTDGYKVYHVEQYPKEVRTITGNLTARNDKYLQRSIESLGNVYVAFGMQQALKEIIDMFNVSFFNVPKSKAIKDFTETLENYIGADDSILNEIGKLHDHGYLPLIIRTVNEGDILNMNEPYMQIETEDGFAWFFGYMETMLTNMTWKAVTNATIALEVYTIARGFGDMTGVEESALKFGFHDFSSRGMQGIDSARRDGVPHLIYFNGTESVGAIDYIENVYDYDYETEGMIAGSIRATEHSVSSVNIFYNMHKHNIDSKSEAEEKFFLDYITKVYPSGLVAFVADTFDYDSFMLDILPKYKEEINARDGKVVIRPDSFKNPVEGMLGTLKYQWFPYLESVQEYIDDILEEGNLNEDTLYLVDQTFYKYINGNLENYKYAELSEMGSLPYLLSEFGFTYNDKGFIELNPKIGLIYGDGWNVKNIEELYRRMALLGFATNNIVVGVGGGMYAFSSRDTLGIADKATAFTYDDGESIHHVETYKDPKGATKTSAKGYIKATQDENGMWLFEDQATYDEYVNSDWNILYENGILYEVPFSEIRENAVYQYEIHRDSL